VTHAALLGDEQGVDQTHRLDVHGGEQAFDGGHQDRSRRRLVLAAIVHLDRGDRPVHERQRQPAQAAGQVE
jgi:hypothetical protein